MNLRKAWLCLCASLLFGAWHAGAEAALKFGNSERISFVQNVGLKGPAGEQLFLARKLAERHFLLPYSIEDQGYVLGVAGDSKRYYALPQGPQLQAMQLTGLLPGPLPPYELSTMDRIMGHLLWIVLPILLLYGAWSSWRGKGKTADASTNGAPLAPPQPVTQFSARDIALPMTLYPSRKKLAVMLAGSLAFVAIGLLMLQDGDKTMAYLGIGFFGLCALVFVAQLLTRSSYLLIEAHQFTMCAFSRKTTVAWQDVVQFRIANVGGGNKMVGWNYQPGFAAQAAGRALAARMTGVEGALPDTYGLKVAELCDLMNELNSRSAQAAQAAQAEHVA